MLVRYFGYGVGHSQYERHQEIGPEMVAGAWGDDDRDDDNIRGAEDAEEPESEGDPVVNKDTDDSGDSESDGERKDSEVKDNDSDSGSDCNSESDGDGYACCQCLDRHYYYMRDDAIDSRPPRRTADGRRGAATRQRRGVVASRRDNCKQCKVVEAGQGQASIGHQKRS